jgi:hypothetical protein
VVIHRQNPVGELPSLIRMTFNSTTRECDRIAVIGTVAPLSVGASQGPALRRDDDTRIAPPRVDRPPRVAPASNTEG